MAIYSTDSIPTPSLENITYAELAREHPERERWKYKWPEYRLAYRGGHDFLLSAGEMVRSRDGTAITTPFVEVPVSQATPRRRFLRQLEGEPNEVYAAYWDRAFYVNYLGGILDYFRHYLFSQPPILQPSEPGKEPPEWWAPFFKDCTGNGKSFVEFVRDVFLDVEIDRYAGWLIGSNVDIARPTAADDRIALTAYKAEDILDWQCDRQGNLEWIILQKCETRREFPGERVKYVEITYIDRQAWGTWEVLTDAKGQHTLTLMDTAVHGLGDVPFQFFEIPHGLWITDKLFSWQVDIFNRMCRLGNAMLIGCIIQPFISSNDPNASARIFGEGVLLNLKAGDKEGGAGEDMGWKSPQIQALEFIATQLDRQRDEGYRIVHNMAMAIDATVSRLAQSGVSKQEDRRAAEVILAGMGSHVKPPMLRTAHLLSKIYKDDTEWMIDGYDNFQVSSLEEELQTASLVSAFGFWSKTAEAELHKQIETGRILGHVDESVKEQIRKEIDDRLDQEQEEAALGPQQNIGTEGDTQPDGAVVPPKMGAAQPGQPATPAKASPKTPPGPPIKK